MEKNINDENFEEQINSTNKLVLVDFFAEWCEPCSVLAPILEKIAEDFKEKMVLIKTNIDKAPTAAQKYGVEKIPTIVLFKNGQPINGFVGLIPEKAIRDWLENITHEQK